MKLRHLFLCSLAAAAFFAGCKEEDEPGGASYDLTLSTDRLEFTSEKSTESVDVTSDRQWRVEYDESQTWVSVSPEGADGSRTVSITVAENTDYERAVELKFTNGLSSKTLTVVQEGTSSYVTLSEVRALYTGSDVTVPENTIVKGTVVSNAALNNLTSKKTMYIQDATAGLNVYFASNHEFAFGDEVILDLSGSALTSYSGLLEINGLDNAKATKTGSSESVEPKVVPIDDLLQDKYQGQYVAIENCQVASADLDKTWAVSSAANNINIEDKDGKTFIVRTSSYATTLQTQVPQGSGTICGIASIFGTTIQLWFAQESDFAGLTGERFSGPEAQTLTVDEVFTTTATTAKVKGAVVAVSSVSFVINDGGDKNLYVYSSQDVAVGETVMVEGTISRYGKTGTGYTQLVQLSEATVEKLSETITPKSQTPEELTSAQIDAPYSNASSPMIRVNATVVVSGNYTNLDFGGSVMGSVVKSSLDSEFTDRKVLSITGYFAGVNGGGYFCILPTEVEASEASFFGVSSTSLNVSASATSATFDVTGNVDWTVTSETAGFTVSPASGNGAGTVTVEFAENTSEEARTATIKVSTTADVATKEYIVTLTQAAKASGDVKPLTSNVEWTANQSSSSYSETATVNGTPDVAVLKLGTSSKTGSATLTIPAGTKKVGFYGVAWNKQTATVKCSFNGVDVGSQGLKGNSGAANNSPYTITVTDDDYYEITIPVDLSADTEVIVETIDKRAILFGINAYTE